MDGSGHDLPVQREEFREISSYSDLDLIGMVDRSLQEFAEPALEPIAGVQDGRIAGPLRELLLSAGKRIRPLFAIYGAALGGARELNGRQLRVATALELFHAFALIHDDIIDNAEMRRGNPSLHRRYGSRPERMLDHRESEQRARSLAMLAGDLVLCWADMLFQSGLGDGPGARLARTLFDRMRTEIMVGQAMDTCYERSLHELSPAITSEIIEKKTAKYTFVRPMQLGAAISGAPDRVIHRCKRFATPLGRAFQLRDDLIGAFDDGSGGKSGTTDLECGKPTELVRYAVAAAGPPEVDVLLRNVGKPDLDQETAEEIRAILSAAGAVEHVSGEIEKSVEAAARALPELECEPWLAKRLTCHLERLLVEPGSTEKYRSKTGEPVGVGTEGRADA